VIRNVTVEDVSAVAELVRELVAECEATWWSGGDVGERPPLPGPYDRREQARRERELDRFLDVLEREAARLPRSSAERRATQGRILSAFEEMARSALDFEERHLRILLESGLPELGAEFARAARRYDPTITGADVFQASRNVWAMNGLQMLMGLPARLTPSIFAYSMLYPYTDNYLDSPSVPWEEKAAFNRRFTRRLLGEDSPPVSEAEQRIFDLVGLIESEYDRARYPGVYGSLLAIQRAQERSVLLLRPDTPPYEIDVLGISLEKGGTSVLADGYLVAGELSDAQARFLFGYGAYLQLVDDLQDVDGDRRAGLMTVFSQSAERWMLDRLADRVLSFGEALTPRLESFSAEGTEPLKELMAQSARQLLVDAVGCNPKAFSRDYLRKMEAHHPFRFAALRKRRRWLQRRRVDLMRLVELLASPEESGSVSFV